MLIKARHIYDATGLTVFADDTGLEVDALGGLRFIPHASQAKTGFRFVLKNCSDAWSTVNRKARFRTVIALIHREDTSLKAK